MFFISINIKSEHINNIYIYIYILKSFNINFCHAYDKTHKFRTSNDKIFRIACNGVFVIDKNKNVIFTGSPIATEENWKSFIKLVEH
jgi:hypothetical protein